MTQSDLTRILETHYEIVAFLTTELINCNPLVEEYRDKHGTGFFYETTQEWTMEFEKLHAGREWDGDFFDTIEAFCDQKLKAL